MNHIFPLSIIVFSMLAAFLIAISFSPLYLKFLHQHKLGKNLRTHDTTGALATIFRSLHAKKEGTPTMGGILIWLTVLVVVLGSRLLSFWGFIPKSLLDRGEVYLPLFTLITMGILGAIDDYLNIIQSKHKGLAVKPKFFFIFLFAAIGACWFYFKLGYASIYLPYLGDIHLGLWYIPLFIFIILASANAVNITDGLDGLAGGLLVPAFGALAILAYVSGLFTLSTFCAVIIGATLAFLWHNVPPAKFYMGDTGALALGATLGVISMMTNFAFILPIIGSVFVIETLSVIIQVSSKKLRHGKKVFKIAPLHHHFEAIGWTESQVVMRAWIFGGFFTCAGIVLGLLAIN
ncbi:MAG TPA: phospho-N-acetylmuramoyl-pentapeptide-transferase [Candidatus Gracilibacteria bacterium]|nr:phospho-N-acetylmuramoyl-pentapeptide-transferase [Candidatus Gracilibacteria bacterium]